MKLLAALTLAPGRPDERGKPPAARLAGGMEACLRSFLASDQAAPLAPHEASAAWSEPATMRSGRSRA